MCVCGVFITQMRRTQWLDMHDQYTLHHYTQVTYNGSQTISGSTTHIVIVPIVHDDYVPRSCSMSRLSSIVVRGATIAS